MVPLSEWSPGDPNELQDEVPSGPPPSIEQSPEIRTLAPSGVSRMTVSSMNRSEVQVSEVILLSSPQLLGTLERNGREEPESRRQKQKPNLKTGTAETEAGPQKWSGN